MTKEYNSSLPATEYYVRSMERLLIVAQNLCLARTLEEITRIVLVAVRELTSSDGATFVLLDNGFCYYVDENSVTPLWKGQRFPMNSCMGGWVILNRQPEIIEDASSDERISWPVYQTASIKSMAMVPIQTEEPVGAIGTYWSKQHQTTPEEVKLLQLLADNTAVAMTNMAMYRELERTLSDRSTALEIAKTSLQQETQERKAIEAEVRRISLTDELTGLHNWRGFQMVAEQQLRLAKRSQLYTSIMFIELNQFEFINQTFGHEFGEDAIVITANLLKRSLRNSDTLGRIEENQFVVLVQGYQLACKVIQQRMETNLYQFNQTAQLPFQISLNIGVHSYDSDQTLSLDDLIKLAHTHIYPQESPQSENIGE
jgi:diguanylate cyclase (GGDEF)-like protein